MNNNSWFKKEKPILTLPGLGGGSASNIYWRPTGDGPGYTYVDDVFSTYLYKGNQVSKVINNGIKLGNANAGNSVDFNGSSEYLSISDSTDFDLAAVDFTIECWYYPRSNPSWAGLISQWPNGNYNTTNSWTLEPVGQTLNFYYCMTNGTLSNIAAPGSLTTNQWHHCAVVKKNNQLKCFLNGSGSSWSTIGATLQNSTEPLTIGGLVASSSGSGWADGRISNVRITKGQCLYENNFTPSTDPLTTTSQSATESNVKLLCCNSSIITGATVTPHPIKTHDTPIASNGPFTASDGAGGLVWTKSRSSSSYPEHALTDTERGVGQELQSNSDAGQNFHNHRIQSFDNSGYLIGPSARYNGNNVDYVSWTWRKAPGFFTCLTYSGNGTQGRTVDHDLGCVPGCIMIKCTSHDEGWQVYHRGVSDTPQNSALFLNQDDGVSTSNSYWNNTAPTSTQFTLYNAGRSNDSGKSYVAYLFAGGASGAATAKSTDFNGNNEILYINDSTFNIGTADYTVECWIKLDGSNGVLNQHSCIWTMDNYNTSCEVFILNSGTIGLYSHSGYLVQSDSSGGTIKPHQWYHIAVSRSSGTVQMFVNGVSMGSASQNSITANSFYIGCERSNSGSLGSFVDGKVSNLRVVKGTALYTSSFIPPNKPLENISNTELLCCNSNTATGATVTPSTINASGTPTGEVDSPFVDPDGLVFGDNQEEIIKCGSFVVNASGTASVHLGWEPQWWLWKKVNSNGGWGCYDAMRGVVTGDNDHYLEFHNTNDENNTDVLTFTPTGVECVNLTPHANATFIFMAVRRPDGYVGKPAEAGTSVFNVVAGTSSANPTFISGFPVDFMMQRKIAQTQDWYTGLRLTGDKNMRANDTIAETTSGSSSTWRWDYSEGWHEYTADQTANRSWMWKRHAGFDVVAVKPKGPGSAGETIRHDMGKVPEMIWAKTRAQNSSWSVYHKGLNGGTNPEQYRLKLDSDELQQNTGYAWNNEAPNAATFRVGGWYDNQDSIFMLFSSVEGISKCGYYTGSSSGPVITLGFKPRLIIIKRTDSTGHWCIYDTTRGLGGTGIDDIVMFINDTGAQISGYDYFDMVGSGTTAGFQHIRNDSSLNSNGGKYIYYAHA